MPEWNLERFAKGVHRSATADGINLLLHQFDWVRIVCGSQKGGADLCYAEYGPECNKAGYPTSIIQSPKGTLEEALLWLESRLEPACKLCDGDMGWVYYGREDAEQTEPGEISYTCGRDKAKFCPECGRALKEDE